MQYNYNMYDESLQQHSNIRDAENVEHFMWATQGTQAYLYDDRFGNNNDQIDYASPAAPPLAFPTPRIHRAETFVAKVYDHLRGNVFQDQDILKPVCSQRQHHLQQWQRLVQEPSRSTSKEHAYLTRKEITKTKHGTTKICSVLRKREHREEARGDQEDAEWETTDKVVVLKCSALVSLNPRRAGNNIMDENPTREAAALQHVGNYHPNILGCIEILQDETYLYTVTPYCSGGDLYGKIVGRSGVAAKAAAKSCGSNDSTSTGSPKTSGKRLGELHARVWFRQLVEGLCHLQKKGVCHRDLSLDNLFIDERGVLMIADFGLAIRVPYTHATNLEGITDVSEGCTRRLIAGPYGRYHGSERYLAPELLVRDEDFDGFAVDLWASAVILFVMLVGLAPFSRADRSDQKFVQISVQGRLQQLIATAGIPISDEVVDLLQRMLRRDPRRRLTLAEVMSHPWVAKAPITQPEVSIEHKPHRMVHFDTSPGRKDMKGNHKKR